MYFGGRNGSGKQYLDQLLTGGELLPESVGTFSIPNLNKVGMVSFESQQEIYEHELKIDATNDTNANDIGTPG